MLESFFVTVNQWIAGGTAVAAAGCFLWGVISVLLSPCHLASIPLIIAYVGGQQKVLKPREAGYYAAFFTLGLFLTIAGIGVVCALMGRMLGDIGNDWQILIGLVLVWVALGMLGVKKFSMSGSLLHRFEGKGSCLAPFCWGWPMASSLVRAPSVLLPPSLLSSPFSSGVASGILFILLFAHGAIVYPLFLQAVPQRR